MLAQSLGQGVPLVRLRHLTALLLCWALCVYAVSSSLAAWHIHAQKFIFYGQEKFLLAEGQVRVTGEGLTIFCPRLRYDFTKHRLTFWGPLQVRAQDGDYLEATRGWLDLRTQMGEVEKAHLYLRKDQVHVVAQEMMRLSSGEYRAQKALITTCTVCGPRCSPSWSFRCRRLRITTGGQGKAYHATFNVRKWPIFYSPYFSMALKADRKTGFLFPRLVHGSREGFGWELPFFWAINDSLDLTFFPYYTGKRGFMTGLEGRYALDQKSKGIFRLRYLHDRLHDNDYNHDGLIRTNQNRYWFTAKIDQALAPSWMLRLDADVLSDKDFLYEFAGGKLGFQESHRSYLHFFGRGLEEENTPYRTNRIWLTHRGDSLFFQTSATYYDSLVPDQQKSILMPLPRTDLDWLRQPLWKSFSWSLGLRHTYWWREEGSRGQRVDFSPALSWAPHFFPFDLDLTYHLRDTFYLVNWQDPRGTRGYSRHLYEVETKAGLTFVRIYPFEHGNFKGLRHSIRPEIRYFYRPKVDQEELPLFSEEDRLPAQNTLRYGILQYLTAKRSGSSGPTYFDLARIWLYQSLDLSGGSHPFSDLALDAEFSWPPSFSLRTEAAYNFYGSGFYSLNVTSLFRYGRGEYVGLDYRWDDLRNVNQLGVRLKRHLYGHLFGSLNLKKSLVSGETISSQWGLSYLAQCWSATFFITSNPDETRFSLFINLLGIGGFGRTFGP